MIMNAQRALLLFTAVAAGPASGASVSPARSNVLWIPAVSSRDDSLNIGGEVSARRFSRKALPGGVPVFVSGSGSPAFSRGISVIRVRTFSALEKVADTYEPKRTQRNNGGTLL